MDRATKSDPVIDWTITPVATFTFSHEKVEEDVSKRGLECQKILLQAGADPTLGLVDTWDETSKVESMIQMTMFGSSGGRQTKVSPRMIDSSSIEQLIRYTNTSPLNRFFAKALLFSMWTASEHSMAKAYG